MDSGDKMTFSQLAVIGAGNMGSGIAQKMAMEGFEVLLLDLDDEKVARGLAAIRKSLDEAVERKLLRSEQARETLNRVRGTAAWDELGHADLVVEAVFEDEGVKRDVLARLDEVCRADAILATNTSSLAVSALAASTRRPERVLGLHYFYHPAKNRLVEVVPGTRTDPANLRAAWQLQELLGKTPIASADAPGFIVNRYFVPWLNEATRIVEEGLAGIPTVEQACQQTFGAGLGPFQLMNVTGVPIALHAATSLGRAFGALYAPSALLRSQVETGRPWELAGRVEPERLPAVGERMLSVIFLVAASLVDEKVGTIEDTDIGARVGLRWPRGPFEMMNRCGVTKAARLAQGLCQRWELALPRTLAEAARRAEPFKFRLVTAQVRDGIATLTINRPDALNALDEQVVAQLHDEFRKAAGAATVRGIVITGAGKAFIAGADVRLFVRGMESGELGRVVAFTQAGHDLLNEIDRCPKPVVARVQGTTMGGGLELALACDRIVATDKATLAFPETGLGIYPGLGGTQRTPRRIGAGLAKWLIFTGQVLTAAEALAVGLVDQVVPYEQLDCAVARALDGSLQAEDDRGRPADLALLERFFEEHSLEQILAGRVDTQHNPRLQPLVERVRSRAPLALKLSEQLIDQGQARPLAEGLQLELEHLVEIFRTEDAYEGLSSLGKRKPVFRGR